MLYARIVEGKVFEIIVPGFWEDGTEQAIGDMFTPDFVAQMVDITNVEPKPKQNWVYENGVFSEPVPPVLSAAEVLANNTAIRDSLLDSATRAIAPLQDAVDLEEATAAETAMLKKWKQYRVAVNRVDLTANPAAWPTAPA